MKRALWMWVVSMGCMICMAPALSAQNHKQQQKFLPKPLKKLYFGMSMEEFARSRKRLSSDQLVHDSFRYQWLEKFGPKGPIEAVMYYFTSEGEKQLYEMIIFYRDVQARTQFLEKRYGPPNSDEVEWRLPTGEGFILRAWNYKDRLVIVGVLPGTEWDQEE